jgi:hypothetical protein
MLPETHRNLTPPPLHPALKPYRADLEAVAKPTWLLKCREAETVSRFETQIGGNRPFVLVDGGWPRCERCGKPLDFIWQIDFADFAGVGTFARQGLFQFFYCWHRFAFPQDGFGWASRWYPDFDAEQMNDVPQLDALDQLKEMAEDVRPRRIETEPFLSVLGKFDAENPIPTEAQNTRVSEDGCRIWAVYGSTESLYLEGAMLSRVGGHPPWVQFDDDMPQCPVCGGWAELIGAIGSHDTGLLWDDSGYWYVFACWATEACGGLDRPMMVHQCY